MTTDINMKNTWPVVLVSAFICGCAHSPIPKLYLLRSEIASAETVTEPATEKPFIILRPVQMAEYLSRPQIVIRTGEREVANAEFERWAEPLDAQADSYLADVIAAECKNFAIRPFPWRSASKPLMEISISISQLDGIPGDSVRLRADWQISKEVENSHIIIGERSSLVVKCSQPGIPGVVAATEELLKKLGQEIAAAINTQPSSDK